LYNCPVDFRFLNELYYILDGSRKELNSAVME
jgi:hypothetical protein